MMWRLNFLVIMTCLVLQNSYMLYYICPMHTLFTIMVYGCLGIYSKVNTSPAGILTKWALPPLYPHFPLLCNAFSAEVLPCCPLPNEAIMFCSRGF